MEPNEIGCDGVASEDPQRKVPSDSPRLQLRTRRPADWRWENEASGKWDWHVLAVTCSVGLCGTWLSLALLRFPQSWAAPLSLSVMWIGLIGAVVFAFARSRPPGLLRFSYRDILWGVLFGCTLRIVQGIMDQANLRSFPGSGAPYQAGIDQWLINHALPSGLMGPVVEELFFRAVILVSVFQILRYHSGLASAALAAALASAGAFVLLHAAFAPLSLRDGLQYFLLSLLCSLLVLSTGRIWGAVVLHVVYNSTFLGLSLVGALLS